MNSFIRACILVILLAFSQTGCVLWPLVLGITFGAGTVLTVQERSLGNSIDDTSILVKINKELLKVSLFSSIKVKVSEGRVLLMGNVFYPKQKLQAEGIAWRQQGVKEVINEIIIKNDAFGNLSNVTDIARDSLITTQIKLKIMADNSVKSVNYSVNTINAVVYLMGIAQDKVELSKVVSTARKIKGVKQVVSYVRFKDSKLRV